MQAFYNYRIYPFSSLNKFCTFAKTLIIIKDFDYTAQWIEYVYRTYA